MPREVAAQIVRVPSARVVSRTSVTISLGRSLSLPEERPLRRARAGPAPPSVATQSTLAAVVAPGLEQPVHPLVGQELRVEHGPAAALETAQAAPERADPERAGAVRVFRLEQREDDRVAQRLGKRDRAGSGRVEARRARRRRCPPRSSPAPSSSSGDQDRGHGPRRHARSKRRTRSTRCGEAARRRRPRCRARSS